MKTKNISFFIYDMLGNRSATKANRILEYSQYWERKRIEEFQRKRLFIVLDHAHRNIPYYKNIIRKAPDQNWSFEDMVKYLRDIPILTKADVQEYFNDLIDPKVNKDSLVYQRSGGTTGKPTQFYHDREKLDFTRVALQRNFDWAGYTMRKACLKLASGQYEVTINKGIKGKVKNLLFNRYFYEGAFLNNENWAEEVYSIIKKKKIKVLWGYASILFMLAKELENEKNIGIETIITSSETLLPSQRKKIEKTFECKVFDDYGSREFMVAAECNTHKGMHINEEIVFVEILDEQKRVCLPGTSGDLIITDLFNMSFPFIRFEIGDRGSFYANEKPCECGRTLKRLATFDGRSSENIKFGDMTISQSIFPDYFKTVDNVESYQILAYNNSLTINVILYDKKNIKTLNEIKDHLNSRFEYKIQIDVQSVSSMIQEPNGKVLVLKKMD